MTYQHIVTMDNDGQQSEKLNRICDKEAPAVNTRCVGATTKEVTFAISGTREDVEKVYRAGKRERLW